MHDPNVLALSIRRPLPTRPKRTVDKRSKLSTRFVRYRGWELFFPSLVDVWHVEPGGRDAGKVCGYPPHDRTLARWLITHRAHLRIVFIPWRNFVSRRFDRCAHCGKGWAKGHPVNVSHQWDGESTRWGRSAPSIFHSACSSIVTLRRQLDEANQALRAANVTDAQLQAGGMKRDAAWRVLYHARPKTST